MRIELRWIACCLVVACTPAQRGAVRDAIDVAKTACIIAHQMLPDSEVAQICGVTAPLFGPMQDILSSARAASSQAVAASRTGACPPYGKVLDAGAP